jgi:hypothetical protein
MSIPAWWPEELRYRVASDLEQILLANEGLPMLEWPAHSLGRMGSASASFTTRSRAPA